MSLSLPVRSICSLMPSLMDYSIFLATSVLFGRDLSHLILQIFQHLSQTVLTTAFTAFLSALSSPCFIMLRQSYYSLMRYSCARMLLQSPLVVSYLHSAMIAPPNSLILNVSPPFSISSLATFIWFSSQVWSNFEKSAQETTAKVQNCRVQRSSSQLLVARQRSNTLLPTVSSKFWFGTSMKSTVLRCAGFHFMQPSLVPPRTQCFSSWLNMSPSFQWGKHLVYLRIMKSVMLNLGHDNLKKSLMRTSISDGLTPSISLHLIKLVAHSRRSLKGIGQMFLPRWIKASKIRYRICPPFYLISQPSNTSITDLLAPQVSVEAAQKR